MASMRTNFIVGLFLIIGIAATAATIIYVGATSYFQKGSLYVTYFDESVQGLNKDSPVKYRGVSIGQVHDIRISKDDRLIEVMLRIDPDWKPGTDTIAQLKSIGITGIMFVELDLKKPGESVLLPTPAHASAYPVIPTRSSDIRELLGSVTEVVEQLKGLDLAAISEGLKETLTAINKTLADAQVKTISNRLDTAILNANRVISSFESAAPGLDAFTFRASQAATRVDDLITTNEKELNDAIANMKAAMTQIREITTTGAAMLGRADTRIDTFESRLLVTIGHLEEISGNLRQLTAKGASQPSQLFFSAPLPEKKIESYDGP